MLIFIFDPRNLGLPAKRQKIILRLYGRVLPFKMFGAPAHPVVQHWAIAPSKPQPPSSGLVGYGIL